MKPLWTLVVAILVTGTVFATQNDVEGKVKRQTTLETTLGPNGETILVRNEQEVVYLTGSDARMFDIMAGETVSFLAPNPVVAVSGDRVGPFMDIFRYTNGVCPPLTANMGPGKLYLSTGLAYFTNCQNEITEIAQFVGDAQALLVDFDVNRIMDGGRTVSQLDINNGEFQLILQGASSIRLESGQRVSYSGRTLRAAGEVVGNNIEEFFVVRMKPGSTTLTTTRFNTTTASQNFLGPGQLYVGETKAVFIEDISFRSPGSTNPAISINQGVVDQTFGFVPVGDTIDVTNQLTIMPVITLSSDTKVVNLPEAFNVSYSSDGNVRFVSRGGRVTTFPGVQMFSVFDRNEMTSAIAPSTLDLEFSSVGGNVYIDTTEDVALFVSDSNPSVATTFNSRFTLPDVPSYGTTISREGVRLLTSTSGSPPVTKTVQTLTGAYVLQINELETVTYRDNEIVVEDSMGNTIRRITEVAELITDTGKTTSGNFNSSTVVPFRGPGTLSYSRGTAFYTRNQDLGRNIAFQSATAPIPRIDFKAEEVTVNQIQGINYTEYRVEQRIGGDRVVTFEATSYRTTSSQEIIYSGGQVSVHTPFRVGGMVMYDGRLQTVTYVTENGSQAVIRNVDTFNYFSGGEISSISSPGTKSINLPGNIYTVVDESDNVDVLFTSSNIVTPEVARFIRQGEADFILMNIDQFSSIYTGVFNLSMDSATVSYGGGGDIWYSTSADGTREALYVDDEGVSNRIVQSVSTLLLLTKHQPAKRDGVIRTIFNGRDIYPYSPVLGNRDVIIKNFDSFSFNGTALVGTNLPDGPYTGINNVVVFDGVEVRTVNSSHTTDGPVEFKGYGLLLVQNDSDTAFYTTSVPAINFLRQAIANLKDFLVAPSIRAGTGEHFTKQREANVTIGTDVIAYQGASISFNCDVVGGRPEPSFGFYKIVTGQPDMKLNNSVEGITVENNTLTVEEITLEDSGVYRCIASNGVPPDAKVSSSLTVRRAVAPEFRPRYYPYPLQENQRLVWPNGGRVIDTVILAPDIYSEIVLACRFTGRPRAMVDWLFNDVLIENVPELADAHIVEVVEGASILTIPLVNFRDPFTNILLGENIIQCSGSNAAGGVARGMATIKGIIYDECDSTEDTSIPCSRTCGQGIRELLFEFCTLYEEEGMGMPVEKEDIPLSVVPLSERFTICTDPVPGTNLLAICPITEYRWNVSEWSECSRTCGGGTRTRNVTCLNVSIPIDNRYIPQLDMIVETEAEDNMCVMFERAGERPAEQELCEEQRCPFWQASKYSMCSATCDGGISEREVQCIELTHYKDENGTVKPNITVVDDADCNPLHRPNATRPCNTQRCFYRWSAGQFGECGVISEFPNCRERAVNCSDKDNNVVDDTFCSHLSRPSILSSCGFGRCYIGLWSALPWTDCSVSCGYGTQTREVQCYSPDTRMLVTNYFCDIAQRPLIERQCFPKNCEGECLRDESRMCPILAGAGMCGSDFAMANNGLRCCVSCMGMAGGD